MWSRFEFGNTCWQKATGSESCGKVIISVFRVHREGARIITPPPSRVVRRHHHRAIDWPFPNSRTRTCAGLSRGWRPKRPWQIGVNNVWCCRAHNGLRPGGDVADTRRHRRRYKFNVLRAFRIHRMCLVPVADVEYLDVRSTTARKCAPRTRRNVVPAFAVIVSKRSYNAHYSVPSVCVVRAV